MWRSGEPVPSCIKNNNNNKYWKIHTFHEVDYQTMRKEVGDM